MMSRTAAVLASTLLSVLVLVAPADATFPGSNGRIAFGRGGDIWTMHQDGTDQRHLPNDAVPGTQPCARPPLEFDPAWSPDGSKLAVGGTAGVCQLHIYVMNADGSGLTPLKPPYSAPETRPTWSPDGSKIAFVIQNRIYGLMEADGSNRVQLPAEPGYPASSLDWSPDGQSIAYSHSCVSPSGRQGAYIALMQPFPGGTRTPLTYPTLCTSTSTVLPNTDKQPSWSPDAQRILFVRNRDILSIRRDGTDLASVHSGPLPDGGVPGDAVWSPDGTKIAFTWATADFSTGTLHRDIAVMNADGSAPTRIAADGTNPDWQPIPGPQRSDYKNAAQFCKAEQAFWGDQFAGRYGGGPNAYGKCVSQSH